MPRRTESRHADIARLLILSLPGLRRVRERIRQLVQQLDESQKRVAALKDRLARAASGAEKAKAHWAELRDAAEVRAENLRRKINDERQARAEANETHASRRAALQAQVASLSANVEALRTALLAARRQQASPDVLAQTLRPRLVAVRADARAAQAREREHAFRISSPAYADAVRREAVLIPAGDAEMSNSSGLVFWVPRDLRKPGGLADRVLRQGWLPWADILSAREVGVGTAMLDIGANIGTTSIPRVLAGDVQYVYAAEPDPLNYACLVKNVLANGLGGFVMPDHLALSDTDGEAVLSHRAAMANHHLVPAGSRASHSPDGVEHIRIPALTVDSWIERLGLDPALVSFVKCDTQGWESHVLAGAGRLLAHKHIGWMIEFSPKHLDAAGTGSNRLIDQILAHFTHFIDLRGPVGMPRVMPVTELRTDLAYLLERHEKSYTNLILYSAG